MLKGQAVEDRTQWLICGDRLKIQEYFLRRCNDNPRRRNAAPVSLGDVDMNFTRGYGDISMKGSPSELLVAERF
jgi:hypothetical protein